MNKDINRRRFIKNTAVFGTSAFLLGSNTYACKEDKAIEITDIDSAKRRHVLSIVNSSTKVLPDDILGNSNSVTLAGASNEVESFQIVIRSTEAIDEVKVEMEHLKNGVHQISGLRWRQVGYVYVSTFDGHPNVQDVAGLLPGWYPDPLLERDSVKVLQNTSNVIWVDCPIPKGTAPGVYVGEIRVHIGKVVERVTVSMEVFGFELPDRSTLPTLFSLSLEFLDSVYPNFDRLLRSKWFNFIAENRLAPTDMYINLSSEEAKLKISSEEYALYINNLNGFVLYPITSTWEDRNASAEELIARFESNRPYIDTMIRMRYVEKGNGVFYGFDENDTSHFETMKEVHKHIKSVYPTIPIATTSMHINSVELLEDLEIDILVLHITDGIYTNRFADQVRATGRKVWGYISLQPYHPMPNWRIENPFLDSRVLLSAMAYHQRFDGFLYWGLNQYNKIGWKYPNTLAKNTNLKLNLSITTPTDEYKWLHGDGILLYPGEDGPISSIRMENIRKGLEEYEYYCLLEKKFGKAEAHSWATRIAPSMEQFSDNVQQYLHVKKQIADRLMNGS